MVWPQGNKQSQIAVLEKWPFSLFPGNDTYLDRGDTPMIHTELFTPEIYAILLTAVQMVLNSRRMNLLVANRQVRLKSIIFLNTLLWVPSNQWKHGDFGKPGSKKGLPV